MSTAALEASSKNLLQLQIAPLLDNQDPAIESPDATDSTDSVLCLSDFDLYTIFLRYLHTSTMAAVAPARGLPPKSGLPAKVQPIPPNQT